MKKWIKGATANADGQFKAKAEKAGLSTKAFAEKAQHAPGRTGRQARLALTLMGMDHAPKRSTEEKKAVRYDRGGKNG